MMQKVTGLQVANGAVWISPHNKTTRHCKECRKSYIDFWRWNQKTCLDCEHKITYSAIRCRSCSWKKIWNEGKIDSNKISVANKGKHNSVFTEFRKGEKPWNFGIGYSTSLVRKIRELLLYSEWRMDVLVRDKFTCQICGKIGKKLNVDHSPDSFARLVLKNDIQTLEQATKCQELWNVGNGRTLCIDCHKKTDNYAKNYAN